MERACLPACCCCSFLPPEIKNKMSAKGLGDPPPSRQLRPKVGGPAPFVFAARARAPTKTPQAAPPSQTRGRAARSGRRPRQPPLPPAAAAAATALSLPTTHQRACVCVVSAAAAAAPSVRVCVRVTESDAAPPPCPAAGLREEGQASAAHARVSNTHAHNTTTHAKGAVQVLLLRAPRAPTLFALVVVGARGGAAPPRRCAGEECRRCCICSSFKPLLAFFLGRLSFCGARRNISQNDDVVLGGKGVGDEGGVAKS